MNKQFLTVIFFIFALTAYSQNFEMGLKGGMNYNFSGDLYEIKTIGDDIIHGYEESVGFHGGLFVQANSNDLFLRLETNYTEYKTHFEGNDNLFLTGKRVDVPLLLGSKIIGPVDIFAGPDFQYILNEDFSVDNTEVRYDDFTMGLQLGAGVDLGRVSFDVRWDKGLSESQSQITNSEIIQQNFTLDNRPNQIIFSLNIKLTK